MPYYYQLRIRNAADSADALVVTSVPSGTNPFISAPPSGDGQGFNPRTGATEVGAYTVRIADNGAAANVITGFLSDGNGRYDKLGRRAYMAYGTDGTTFPNLLVAGYVTALSYPSAAEAQVSIGEAQRAERVKQAFVTASASFPATTMLGGGPVRWPTGVNPPVTLPNYGRWTVKRFDTPAGNPVTFLQFVSGYVLNAEQTANFTFTGIDNWVRATEGAFPIYMQSRINTLTATEVPGATIMASSAIYRHGNVYADVYSGDTFLGTFHAGTQRSDLFMQNGGFFLLEWTNADPAGTQYQVYLYTRTVSENSPLHLLMHPVDVVTGLITDAGELWDATSAAAVKASIGADVRVFERITSSEGTDAAIARHMGLFGFGRRINSANAWEFFDQRTKPSAVPATTIALDDLREIPTDVWVLEDSTILNNVTVVAERFAVWNPGQSSTRPPDGLVPVEQKRTARFQLADGTFPDVSQGVKELTYELPGTILNAQGAEVNLTDFTNALGAHAFDRWGYGAPSSGLPLRTNIAAQIGDEVLLQLNYLPNVNVRGGQRIVQIVQRTNEPGGPVLRVEDSGSSAQPAVAPTFTVTAGASLPRAQADVTLTNAVALAAAGVQSVLFEWIVSVGTPVIAGQDLGAISPASPVVLTTPSVAAGSKVWARAKSIQPGRRAGVFTAWAGVTLSTVGNPSSLIFTADPTDGSAGTLSWTAGTSSATYSVRILRRLSALSSASDAIVSDLKYGSTLAALTEMTPGQNYTVTVQYMDPSTGIIAASATLTFTAGLVVLLLPMPVYPAGIVGRTDQFGVSRVDGTYGLDVTASVIPGTIEFWEAVETAVASGVYGTSVLVSTAPAVSGDVTTYRNIAPHDGLRRSLKARHVRTGTTSSDYTTPIALDPWGALMLPGTGVPFLSNLVWQDDSTTRTYAWIRSTSADTVWVYDRLLPIGSGNVWPAPTDSPSTILSVGTDSYAALIPPKLYQRFIQFEPRTADGSIGEPRRVFIDAPAPLGLIGTATTIAATTTTIDVQLTGTDPAGTASITISLADSGTPPVTTASLGGNQWRLTRPAWNAHSGRVTFNVSAPGRETVVVGVTVPPQTSQVTTKRETSSGLGLLPENHIGTYTKNPTQGYAANFTPAVSTQLCRDVALADGVTITGFESKTYRNATGDNANVTLTRQNRATRALVTLANHSSSTTLAIETNTTTGLTEVVDNATYTYYVEAFLVGAAFSDARVYDYSLYITSNDLSQA